MTIIDLQRRLHENGRIRIGQKVPTQSGKTRPAKLDTFRLTSQDRSLINAAAKAWGGTPEPWPDAPTPNQYQVVTEADSIACVVPPSAMAFSQSYEQWTAGGCKVRCDGRWDSVGDCACHCDPTNRACDIHSRLSVLLPDLPGLGVWRLDTQGYYAAVELGGVVDVCQGYADMGAGRLLPARLRLAQRSVKRPDANGEVVTLRFVVPVLDVDISPLALLAPGLPRAEQTALGTSSEESREDAAPPSLTTGHVTPVPNAEDVARAFQPSVSEQMAAVDEDRPRSSRRVTPPPTTGLAPRTLSQLPQQQASPPSSPPVGGGGVLWMRTTLNMLGQEARRAFLDEFGNPPQSLAEGRLDEARRWVEARLAGGHLPPVTDEPPEAPEPPQAAPELAEVARKARKVFAADYDAAPTGQKTKVLDNLRHALCFATVGKASTKDCTPEELVAVWQRLEDIAVGRLNYAIDHAPGGGVTFTMEGSGVAVPVPWAEVGG